MTVWLWDAGAARGVTDDETRAREAAEAFIRSGRADTARVERASLVTEVRALTTGYARTGQGWTAQPRRNGPIRWVPLRSHPNRRHLNRPGQQERKWHSDQR